ncbi:TPA: hypothetical protein ACH3X1_009029 [Trebouxia sp. C0004]
MRCGGEHSQSTRSSRRTMTRSASCIYVCSVVPFASDRLPVICILSLQFNHAIQGVLQLPAKFFFAIYNFNSTPDALQPHP